LAGFAGSSKIHTKKSTAAQRSASIFGAPRFRLIFVQESPILGSISDRLGAEIGFEMPPDLLPLHFGDLGLLILWNGSDPGSRSERLTLPSRSERLVRAASALTYYVIEPSTRE